MMIDIAFNLFVFGLVVNSFEIKEKKHLIKSHKIPINKSKKNYFKLF